MIYDWQRRWKSFGSEDELEESFHDINKYRCLILLGEPGSGKSTELENMYNKSSLSIYVDLRGVNSSADLKDKILVVNYDKGDLDSLSEFYIYLDAFDEAVLNYKDIGDSLLELLKNFGVNLKKIYLRITCRTGIWLDYLEDEFSKLWCKDEVKKYILCELSDDDIKNSLDAEKIEYEKFYKEAVNKNIYSLMRIPVTLKFLIDEYRVDQSFSNSKKNLYENGCIKLIEEPNKSKRQKLELYDEYDFSDRLNTAKVIAALTILCGAKYISNNVVKGSKNLISSEISDLFSIYKKNINSILKTAIFKSGSYGYEWTHLSYAEFLAASFINESFDFEKIIALIKHDYSDENKTIPQLHALVGWLTSINEKVFDWVFNNDFDIILLGDLSLIDDKKKAAIVEKIIKSDNNCGTRYFKYSIIEHLQCMETENVIKGFLMSGYYTSSYKNYKVVEFSEILKIEYSFDEMLIGMAHWDDRISSYFCNKYLKYGNDEQLTRLADILNNRIQLERQVNLMPSQRFKIYEMLYPKYISLQEKLDLMCKLHDENNFHFESEFKKSASKYSQDEIYEAIKYCEKVELSTESKRTEIVICHVIFRALLLNNGIRIQEKEKVKGLIFKYVECYKRFICLSEDSQVRRRLLIFIIELKNDFRKVELNDLFSNILKEDDIDWIHNKFEKGEPYYDEINSIYQKKCSKLETNIKLIENSVKLKGIIKESQNDQDYNRWINFIKRIFIDEVEIHEKFFSCWEDDYIIERIEKLLGNEDIRLDINILCVDYLEKYNESPNYNKHNTSLEYDVSLICYYILSVSKSDSIIVDSIKVYRKWMYAILFENNFTNIHKELFSKFIAVDREYILSWMFKQEILDSEDFDVKYPLTLIIRNCLDEFIEDELLANFNKYKGNESLCYILLENLLINNSKKAKAFVEEYLLKFDNSLNSYDMEYKSIVVAYILGQKNFDWKLVWENIPNDEIKYDIMLYIARKTSSHGFYESNNINNLTNNNLISENQYAKFYIWLDKNTNSTSKENSSSDWDINRIKESILYNLKERNSKESREAIKYIWKSCYNEYRVQDMWKEIEYEYLKERWTPFKINEISAMYHNKQKTLIRNGADLLNEIINSLERFNKRMNGAKSIKYLLWDECDSSFKHKNENALSNLIAFHLEYDLKEIGVFVDREVEISPKQGIDGSEIPDIVVQMKSDINIYENVTVYIEVKGSWHKELLTSMESQLINKYMKNKSSYGIYVVGWYGKKASSSKIKTNAYSEIVDEFKSQAKELACKYKVMVNSSVIDVSIST